MSWSEKAKEIAEEIYSKVYCPNPVHNHDNLVDMLEQAALKGMKFELENWMNRPKPNKDIQDEA